jgi:alanyl-tRNA synthetase
MPTQRLYYDDSYIRDFTAKIQSCEPLPPDLRTGRVQQSWAIVLDRTALYPTSGGQPHDRGKLGDANVLDVRDETDEITHIVDRELQEGAAVTCCVDNPRRFDHMQQHTGQHLLSAMFQERAGLPTVSFHLGEDFCTIDLQGPEPSEATLAGIERAANKIIFENRPIRIRYATAEQLEEMGIRKKVERAGMLRVIEIGGADLTPCGGTHVNSTGQIGLILIRRHNKIRQDWRVEFVAGARAERAASNDFQQLRKVANKLQCAPHEVSEAVTRTVADREKNFAYLKTALEQLAAAEATLALATAPPPTAGIRIFEKISTNAHPDYPALFASALAKHENVIALIASAETGQLFFSQSPTSPADLSAILKQLFAELPGKGGGQKNSSRGKLSDPAATPAAIARAKVLLQNPTN